MAISRVATRDMLVDTNSRAMGEEPGSSRGSQGLARALTLRQRIQGRSIEEVAPITTVDHLTEAVAVATPITIAKLAAVTSPTSLRIEARAVATTIKTATMASTTTILIRHRAIPEGGPAEPELIRPITTKVTVGVEVPMSSTITWRTAPTSPRATT